MNCRFMIQFSQTPIFYYWYCSVHSVEFFSTASLNRDAGLERDAALIAMRCFGARRGAPRRYKDLLHQHDYAGEHHREGENPIGCVHMVGRWAGESLRKPQRPRPYSRALAGIPLRVASRSWCHQSQRNVLKRDAAHHVATNALPPYAHERPTATVCAYHAPRMPPTYGAPTVFTTMPHAALDREGSCKKGEHSLRSASPLPRAQ